MAEISYLTQREAAEIDEVLMGPLGFSVDQLMELAGLSVASAIAEVYKSNEYSRILVICGPGNNGGDGLVAARHLYHFGYEPVVCYPKRTPKTLYTGLVTQLGALSVPFLSVEELPQDFSTDFDVIVDAIFGFSFQGKPRPPFDDLIHRLISLNNLSSTAEKSPAIVSVDIPSGWHVEEGDLDSEGGIKPHMLVSVIDSSKILRKEIYRASSFSRRQICPPPIANKYGLHLPPYPGTSMCVRIGEHLALDVSAMRQNYISPEFLEDHVLADPIEQFRKWFNVFKDGLAKGFDENGFVLYTNYESRKARELSANPNASLLFYWDPLNRQVRIEGTVERVPKEESEAYFHSRPRGSQIGAIVSRQSSVVAGRHLLHQAYTELQDKYADGSLIPKPEYWGGYRLTPTRFEFWQGQPSRLHDRLQYSLREAEGKRVWQIERLAP
ncbi:unnamed protein product [Spirodela intermedia]|uniref:NAD(P)H-hydrate epimerase n=1 Tax=Spirodela intermedia TaxID=51605 RepID=A0A7I8IFA1_SPIIN|nr:unnamed protein product [Spirodela intermedia]CAA6656467.1 unnamed protein product [Spirodela intermedia]